MTSHSYYTVVDVLNHPERFIQEKLSHVLKSVAQTPEEKQRVLEQRQGLITEILAILNKNNMMNVTASQVTGIARGIFYHIRRRQYNRISTELCEMILKHLKTFDQEASRRHFDDCVIHHRFLREQEKVHIAEDEIKRAAFKEAVLTIKQLKLSARNLGTLKHLRGSVESILSNRLENISLRRTLEVLVYLRKLSAEDFKSVRSKQLCTEQREKVYQEITDTIKAKNLTPVLVEKKAITSRVNIYYINGKKYNKVSLRKAQSILTSLRAIT